MKINELLREYPEDEGVLFLLDLDDFKKLNDTYGHQAGDNFLREFTSKLLIRSRSNNVLGRIGGEEFVVYINKKKDSEGNIEDIANEVANEILEYCREVRLDNLPDKEFTCSVGVALYPQNGASYMELYKKADTAMYEVKRNGKNNYAFAVDTDTSGDEF